MFSRKSHVLKKKLQTFYSFFITYCCVLNIFAFGKTHKTFFTLFFTNVTAKTCCREKEMIHLNKNSLTPAQKIDLENLLQQSFATLSKLLTFRYKYMQLLKEEVAVEILH